MTDTATEQQVRLAAQLYQARDSVRRLLGDKYAVRLTDVLCVTFGEEHGLE